VRTLKQDKHIREANKKVNGQLTLLTEEHKVRFWTYNVKNGQFTWLDEHGKAAETCTYEEFGRRYNKEDFKQLTDHLARLSTQHKDLRGHEETELTLELKARDPEYADGKLHDFVVTLSVLTRDNDGKPAVIIATKKDVTTELQLKQQNNMRSLRYWTVFYNDESGVITFGADGYLQNANPTACELLSFDIDKEVEKHVHINHLLSTSFTNLNKTDGYRGTLSVAGKQTEYQIKTFCNNKGELLGLIVFCI
jgi:PAS domain-containing protein